LTVSFFLKQIDPEELVVAPACALLIQTIAWGQAKLCLNFSSSCFKGHHVFSMVAED
jgi:hypothetical protein